MSAIYRNLILFCVFNISYINIAGALKIEAVVIKDEGEGEALEETVIVVKSKSDDWKIPCVAVPVDIGTVITVGSCIKDLVNPFIKCDDLAIGKTNNKGKVIGVEKLYLADSYGKNSQSYIALLKLAEPLDFSSVSVIGLPKFDLSYNNKVGQLTTYVRSEQDPTFNPRGSPFYTISSDWFLKTMPIKIQENCLKSEDDSQLCGRSLSQEKDKSSSSCNDHLGGLLVVDNEIVGILSKSNALCNDDESATIYTIPQLFIRNNLDNNSSENINHCKPPT